MAAGEEEALLGPPPCGGGCPHQLTVFSAEVGAPSPYANIEQLWVSFWTQKETKLLQRGFGSVPVVVRELRVLWFFFVSKHNCCFSSWCCGPDSLLLSVCSHLSLRRGGAGVTRKLSLLLGLDQLAVHRPLPHRDGQVRHCIPRLLPHLQWHSPLGKANTFISTQVMAFSRAIFALMITHLPVLPK